MISFCNSCILPVSSRIVFRSSINFLLAIVSNVEPWNRFNSFISLRLFLWASRRYQFLLQQLFMNKLMILSTSFVSLMNSTNFFFVRLDRFIQLLIASSVVIGLEFVFSNLCLTIRENLLSLSLQESPNLFAFRVVSLSFLGARHKWGNNGSPRSIMTDGRRQTGRRSFFFRVIGSSSAGVKERFADGGVIVDKVTRELLFARGLLGAFDISLRDEVVVGLITCGRLVLGQGAKVLSGSTQGICPRHRGSWRCRAVGTAGWSERWWGKRRSEWRSRRDQEQHSKRDDTCACNVGWMRTLSLVGLDPMQCAYIWTRKNSQGTLTLTRRKRDYKNKQAQMWCPRVIGCTRGFPHASVIQHVVEMFTLCAELTCCQCTKLIHFLTCTGIPWRDSYFENGLVRCCLYTHPSVAADRRQRWTIQLQLFFLKSHVWGFIQRRQTMGSQVLSCRFVRRSCVDFHLNYHELHQESLHCHQLEEELDDWCHFWYFQNGTGLSCCSQDYWCRWFEVDNASLKSEWFLKVQIFQTYWEIHQFFLYRKYSACVIWCVKSFCASSSISIQTSSCRSCSSWDARNSGSFTKRWWIPWKCLLMHLFLKLWAIW